MNPQKEKRELKPKGSIVWKIKTVLRSISSCIHSFPNTYGRVYAGALLVNTFGGIKNTHYISHAYYWGTTSSTYLTSSCLVVTSSLSQNDTRVRSATQTGENEAIKKTHNHINASAYMWSIELVTDGAISIQNRINSKRGPSDS